MNTPINTPISTSINTPINTPFNTHMIKRLVVKDWYLQRGAIVPYLGWGALALTLLALGGEYWFFAGSILLLTLLIAKGIHLAMATVIEERTGQTLSFVMSLPISPMEYTIAKVLANMLLFLTAWMALSIGTIAVIAGREAVPDGLIPFTAVILVDIFVGYCLILGVALVTESQAWTIWSIVVTNLLFQAVLYYVSHIPTVAIEMKGAEVVWSRPVLLVLLAEAAAIVLTLAITFYLRSRKTDFL